MAVVPDFPGFPGFPRRYVDACFFDEQLEAYAAVVKFCT